MEDKGAYSYKRLPQPPPPPCYHQYQQQQHHGNKETKGHLDPFNNNKHQTPPNSILYRRRPARVESRPVSAVLILSLAMVMICFIMATPLSLGLTIPAYILANKAEELKENRDEEGAKRLLRWSYLLNGTVVVLGVCCLASYVIIYVAVLSEDISHHNRHH